MAFGKQGSINKENQKKLQEEACYNKLLSEQTRRTGRDAAACVPLALQIRRALKSKRRCYKNGKVRNHADYQRRSR